MRRACETRLQRAKAWRAALFLTREIRYLHGRLLPVGFIITTFAQYLRATSASLLQPASERVFFVTGHRLFQNPSSAERRCDGMTDPPHALLPPCRSSNECCLTVTLGNSGTALCCVFARPSALRLLSAPACRPSSLLQLPRSASHQRTRSLAAQRATTNERAALERAIQAAVSSSLHESLHLRIHCAMRRSSWPTLNDEQRAGPSERPAAHSRFSRMHTESLGRLHSQANPQTSRSHAAALHGRSILASHAACICRRRCCIAFLRIVARGLTLTRADRGHRL